MLFEKKIFEWLDFLFINNKLNFMWFFFLMIFFFCKKKIFIYCFYNFILWIFYENGVMFLMFVLIFVKKVKWEWFCFYKG